MEWFLGFAVAIFAAFLSALHFGTRPKPTEPPEGEISAPEPLPVPSAPIEPPAPKPAPVTVPATVPESEVLRFDTPKRAYHSTRVICDELGLTLVQKNQVCACIFQESRFLNRYADGSPVINQNKDKATGKVWSTDFGIVQVNDHFHCGPGKTFPSVQYVLDNPEKMVRWMAGIMKRTSGLQPWSSWTSGAYRQWLSTDSPMWKLKS